MRTAQSIREPQSAAASAIAARQSLRRMERGTFAYAPAQTPARVKTAAAATRKLHADMHPGVYSIALLCWAAFMAVFFVTFWASANAIFMVDVSAAYAAMFFGVPFVMSRVAPREKIARSGLLDFLRGTVDTLYGPVNGAEALLQVIIIPLSLTIGGVAIGIIIHASRFTY